MLHLFELLQSLFDGRESFVISSSVKVTARCSCCIAWSFAVCSIMFCIFLVACLRADRGLSFDTQFPIVPLWHGARLLLSLDPGIAGSLGSYCVLERAVSERGLSHGSVVVEVFACVCTVLLSRGDSCPLFYLRFDNDNDQHKPLTCPKGESAWAVVPSPAWRRKFAQCKKMNSTMCSAPISCRLELAGDVDCIRGRTPRSCWCSS